MEILIRVQLSIDGIGTESVGHFPVKVNDFRKDHDWTAAVIAYQWIEQIKYETGYRKTEILKVTWNEENDITELVK